MTRAVRRKTPPPSAQMTMPMHAAPVSSVSIASSSTPLADLAGDQQESVASAAPPTSSVPPSCDASTPHASAARGLTLAELDERYAPQRPAFGAWLLKQQARSGFIGGLAKAAAADRRFPKGGDPEAVLKHLASVGADGDMFEGLEDAEGAWLAS